MPSGDVISVEKGSPTPEEHNGSVLPGSPIARRTNSTTWSGTSYTFGKQPVCWYDFSAPSRAS
ncbi:hypothetical protein ACWEIK_30480 [Streptomyces sp. NPDC004673]